MGKHRHQSKEKTSRYKYVMGQIIDCTEYWYIQVPNHTKKRYKTELEAAKAVDMILIKQGKEPVNVLKRA